jgi:hypothetical protein
VANYTIIDQDGNHKGVKALTDAMADRLAQRGYQIIPTDEPVQVIVFKRVTRRYY